MTAKETSIKEYDRAMAKSDKAMEALREQIQNMDMPENYSISVSLWGIKIMQKYDPMSVGKEDMKKAICFINDIKNLNETYIPISPHRQNSPTERDTIAHIDELTKNEKSRRDNIISLRKNIKREVRSFTKNQKTRSAKQAELEGQIKSIIEEGRARRAHKVASDKKHRESQLRSAKEGDFCGIEDKYLRSIFGSWLDSMRIADKSSAHRAILAVTHRYKVGDVAPCYLMGIDDNGDTWRHEINISTDLSYSYEGYSSIDLDVEKAMAQLFQCKIEDINTGFRQGDVLVVPGISEKADNYLPPGHEFMGEYTKIEGGVQNDVPITLVHTSHTPIQLSPGTWHVHLNMKSID